MIENGWRDGENGWRDGEIGWGDGEIGWRDGETGWRDGGIDNRVDAGTDGGMMDGWMEG